jgi:hypothetical protein
MCENCWALDSFPSSSGSSGSPVIVVVIVILCVSVCVGVCVCVCVRGWVGEDAWMDAWTRVWVCGCGGVRMHAWRHAWTRVWVDSVCKDSVCTLTDTLAARPVALALANGVWGSGFGIKGLGFRQTHYQHARWRWHWLRRTGSACVRS